MVACAKIDVGHDAAQTNHGRLAAQRFQIRTHKSRGDLGQMAHVDVPGQRHAPAVDGERLLAPVAVGNGDGNLAVDRPGRRRAGSSRLGRLVRRSRSVAAVWRARP